MICPNVNHPEYKALVAKVGKTRALAIWATTDLNDVQLSTPKNNVLDTIAETVAAHEPFLREAFPKFVRANQAFTKQDLVRAFYERIKGYEGGTISKGYVTKDGKTTTLFPKPEVSPSIKSAKTVTPLIQSALLKLRKQFNVDFDLIYDPSVEWKGKYLNDGTSKRVVINLAHATLDTPFHEYYHPLVRMIKNQNEALYNKMLEEAGVTEEEDLVQRLGEEAAKRMPANWFQKFLTWVQAKFRRFFPNSKELGSASTLRDVLDAIHSTPIDVSSENTLEEAFQSTLKGAFNKMKNRITGQSASDTKADASKDYIKELVDESKDEGFAPKDDQVYSNGKGEEVTRLSPFIGDRELGNFSLKYKGKPYSTAEAVVRKLYEMRGLSTDTPLTVEQDGKKISFTFEELVEAKQKELKRQSVFGKMVHAYFNYALETDRDAELEALQLLIKLGEDYGVQGDILKSREIRPYRENLSRILKNAGLRFQVDENETVTNPDRMAPEVVIVSKLLKIGTTADGIVQHYNGELSIVDWKTGNIMSDYASPLMMAYGERWNINDSKLSRAQLEVVFRALMIKEKHPEAKFRDLMIVKVDKDGNSRVYKIDAEPYLGMIGDFYKATNPEIYAQLQEKGLLEAKNYWGTPVELIRVYNSIKGKPYEEQVQVVQEQLNDITLKYTKEELEGMEYLKKLRAGLTRALLELQKQPHVNLDEQGEDIDTFRGKFKNLSDISNRQVQTLHQIKMRRDAEMHKEMHALDMEHKKLVQAVLEEQNQPNVHIVRNIAKVLVGGMLIYASPWLIPTIFLSSHVIDRIGGRNFDVWSFMWRESKDPARPGWFLNTSNVNPNTGEPLTDAQKAYRKFFVENVHGVWEEVMDKPYAHTENGKAKMMYDLYNMPKKLEADFIPRVMMDGKEAREHNGLKGQLQNWAKNHIMNFFHETEFGDGARGGVPVRYYGHTGSAIVEGGNHSFNAEKIFSMYMGAMLRKKYYDDLITLAEGTKNALEMARSDYGGQKYKNLANWLNDQIYIQFLNQPLPSKLTARKVKVKVPESIGKILDIQPGTYEIEQEKLLRLVKSALSHSVMGFKIIGATFNGMLITITNMSQASTGLLGKAFGIPPEDSMPTFKSVGGGFLEMRKYWKASLTGNLHNSKLWNIAKMTNWMPDNYDFAVGGDNLLSSARSDGFSSYAFMFNNFVESYGALWHLAMMLKSVKLVDVDGNTFTAWDAYDNEGNWIKGVRGKVEVGPGVFKDLKELDASEWKNLKRAYEKLHGSYRKEEKTALEATIWGEFILQFKRYLPAYLKNLYSSPYKDITVGRYVMDPKAKRPDNVPVYKWEEEVMEGRYFALAGALMAGAITPAKLKTLPKDRRKHIMMLLNTGLWFMLAMAFLSPDDDEENTYAGWRWRRLIEDVTMGAKPLDVFHALEKPIVVLTRTSDLYEAFWDYITGVATGKRTRKGEIRGEKTLISSIPPFSHFYQLQKMADQSAQDRDYVFGFLPVDMFEGRNR